MDLQTKVVIPTPPVRISYQTPCLLMGSCFSDYIGRIMSDYKFPLLMNPFGTLFNPGSIAVDLENLIIGKQYTADELLHNDGMWLSFDHYTGFSRSDREECLTGINDSVTHASEWLKRSGFLIITFGTAMVYRYRESGKIVANCHKIPQTRFIREFMTPAEIINLYDRVFDLLRDFNPQLKVIFTLSPVRHWADGAVNNQLSKSVLHYSIQEILKKNTNGWYFPSYEIFMDELRDYRYYATDMLHPSQQGAEYVWEKFLDSSIDEDSVKILRKVEPVLKALRHRPVNADSEAYKKFREATLKKIDALKNEFPFLDFSDAPPLGPLP